MPPKNSLTGGTGDVNPQWFRIGTATGGTITADALNHWITVQAPVPINRLQQQGGKAIVMEVLKARWTLITAYNINIATSNSSARFATGYLSTRAPSGVPTGEPFSLIPLSGQVVDLLGVAQYITFVPGGPLIQSGPEPVNPVYHDLTDNAGHGVLIATDNVWVTVQVAVQDFGSSPPATISSFSAECDLLYRFKEVTLQEYIGIVQSQQ